MKKLKAQSNPAKAGVPPQRLAEKSATLRQVKIILAADKRRLYADK